MIYTSLNEIKSFAPCDKGWRNIRRGQKKIKADGVLFPLTEACESNSVRDVCWLLGKRKAEIQVCVRFAKMCADSVVHLNNKYAADATYAATYAAAAAANAADADRQQKEKNRQFLIQCITEYQTGA